MMLVAVAVGEIHKAEGEDGGEGFRMKKPSLHFKKPSLHLKKPSLHFLVTLWEIVKSRIRLEILH